MKPRCGACDELIFAGQYTKALGKDFHAEHFVCVSCNESLTGSRYVLTDEHPCCIPCYEQNFTHTCRVCDRQIGLDSKDMSYKDLHWHEDCFKCRKCKISLVDKPFAAKNALIFCAGCYDAEFASRCDACGDTFRPGKDDFSLLYNFQVHVRPLDFEFSRKIKAFDWLLGSNSVFSFQFLLLIS